MIDLSRDAIEAAMDEFDAIGEFEFLSRHGRGSARDFWVVSPFRSARQPYPSKAIASVAYGEELGGGYSKPSSACLVLERAGYEITDRAGRPYSGSDSIDADIASLEAELEDTSATDREAIVKARLGQQRFRRRVLLASGGKCEATGLADLRFVRAAHIKRWADCDKDRERLDPTNGIALSVLWDVAFENGLISFDDDGRTLVKEGMDSVLSEMLNFEQAEILKVSPKRASFLELHRQRHGF